ncbi:hypothetical protein A2524_00555 [Candidatus Wolfebacteria bacterium RIFOXYD12_FULL_48_21]|uniref:Uncharacterized protein n=1 Tax=Candidatus Wolfebacteria bacterium RIFOXYD1_FULL_48_65 TaxID=1802561 RepID=A0A1F8DZ55_9BACT|nr:MAG: hypothetical protein A2610_00380 [Candidatus Wolfebacteria bacterium RIFOXYD1_FULL_48_65]OGM94306.1 MAG: hypothetical protein A2524_00555 [Candidatus Wolfebacteria bacterium RIFOXYD12_FULL_48_21]
MTDDGVRGVCHPECNEAERSEVEGSVVIGGGRFLDCAGYRGVYPELVERARNDNAKCWISAFLPAVATALQTGAGMTERGTGMTIQLVGCCKGIEPL